MKSICRFVVSTGCLLGALSLAVAASACGPNHRAAPIGAARGKTPPVAATAPYAPIAVPLIVNPAKAQPADRVSNDLAINAPYDDQTFLLTYTQAKPERLSLVAVEGLPPSCDEKAEPPSWEAAWAKADSDGGEALALGVGQEFAGGPDVDFVLTFTMHHLARCSGFAAHVAVQQAAAP